MSNKKQHIMKQFTTSAKSLEYGDASSEINIR